MEQQTLLSLLQCNNTACSNILDSTSKLLPCQHTLCLECLENRVRLTRFWRCPECKKSVGKNIVDLPTNIWINRLLENKRELNIESQATVLALKTLSAQLPKPNSTLKTFAITTENASPPTRSVSVSENRTSDCSDVAAAGPHTRLRARRRSEAVTTTTSGSSDIHSLEQQSETLQRQSVTETGSSQSDPVSSPVVTRSQARRKAREAAEKKSTSDKVREESSENKSASQREKATSEERKKTLKKCMTVLVHSCHCTEVRCRIKNCMKMKYVQAHARTCCIGLFGGCSTCKNFKILCLYHAKHCQLDSDSCRVPLCQTLKTKLQELVVAFISKMPNAVGKLLECAICLQTLDHTNKYLPCQHTFHRKCLEKLLETLNSTKCVFCQSSMFRCPECRTEVMSKVSDLPSNMCMSRLLHNLRLKVQSEWQATANAAKAKTAKPVKRKKSSKSASTDNTETQSSDASTETEEASVSVNVLPTPPKTRRMQDRH
ncbi:uncharacterized protein LOC121376052 [Gigantopelta aegis]|uniref:uncharacterized protein LOC121376052 n=1 Tax=Gigantopelta aegis TaxID=1735272 RepID=UPI001B88A763|nr:uncharacterized protein LOC121376052 [Gigantopelta aegis]